MTNISTAEIKAHIQALSTREGLDVIADAMSRAMLAGRAIGASRDDVEAAAKKALDMIGVPSANAEMLVNIASGVVFAARA